jgi:hypothetical protein
MGAFIPGMNLTSHQSTKKVFGGNFVSGFENLITFKCNFKAFRSRIKLFNFHLNIFFSPTQIHFWRKPYNNYFKNIFKYFLVPGRNRDNLRPDERFSA